MSYAKILTPLMGTACDAAALRAAFEAAKPFGAHVVALFVRPDAADAIPFFGEGVSGAMTQEIVDAARTAAETGAAAARASVSAAAAAAGVDITQAPQKQDTVSVSFRDMQGNFADRVVQASRLSDLIVFGPLNRGDQPGLAEAFEAVLRETGRPVVLAAQTPPKSFAKRVAIGWDGSDACARALLAAMPYLARAEAIDFLSIQKPDTICESCDEARDYLALHGLTCSEHRIDAGARGVGEVLLEAAAQQAADLLVLGGYGHSRLLQIFGAGVTKHVVAHADIPLFLVH